MIVSRKIADMFKRPGFVNIDYLVKNKLETNPSKILNIISRDWRKWVKPVYMFDGGLSLDPNFGYETIGGTPSSIRDIIKGSVFTITENGTVDSITVALKSSTATAYQDISCAIYKHSDLSLIGSKEVYTSLANTFAWKTFNFASPKPELVIDTEYVLVAWSEYFDAIVYIACTGGVANQGHYQDLTYTGTFPDPLVPTHNDDKYSIYCTYTSITGWTGKISGVTNPAKVMSVATTSISKVKGVS